MLHFTNSSEQTFPETKSLFYQCSFSANKYVCSHITKGSVCSDRHLFYLFPLLFSDLLSIHVHCLTSIRYMCRPSALANYWKSALLAIGRNSERTSKVSKTKSGSSTPFKSFKGLAFYCMNKFTTKVSFPSPGLSHDCGYDHGSGVSREDKWFCNRGQKQVSEVNDLDSIDKCSLFLTQL